MAATLQISALAWLLLAGATAAQAQLTWTETQVVLRSDSTAPTLQGSFHFTNAGATAVDILNVETSCGCTSAELTKRHYEPGQGGDITVTYTRGAHTGRQTNTIEVEASGQPPALLTLIVDIPEVVRLEPAFVTWTHAEARKPKTIALRLVIPGVITKIGVQSSDPAVAAAALGVSTGREFLLRVTPEGTSHFLHAVLTITCELDHQDVKTFTSYATVQPLVAEP